MSLKLVLQCNVKKKQDPLPPHPPTNCRNNSGIFFFFFYKIYNKIRKNKHIGHSTEFKHDI